MTPIFDDLGDDPITGWETVPLSPLRFGGQCPPHIFPPALEKRPDPLRTKGKMGIYY